VGNPNFSILVVENFIKKIKIVSPTIFNRKFIIKQTLDEVEGLSLRFVGEDWRRSSEKAIFGRLFILSGI